MQKLKKSSVFFQSYNVKCTATFFFGTQCISKTMETQTQLRWSTNTESYNHDLSKRHFRQSWIICLGHSIIILALKHLPAPIVLLTYTLKYSVYPGSFAPRSVCGLIALCDLRPFLLPCCFPFSCCLQASHTVWSDIPSVGVMWQWLQRLGYSSGLACLGIEVRFAP